MLEDEGGLNNLSKSNLKDWMGKGRNCFRGGGGLDDVTTLPPHKIFITRLANNKKYAPILLVLLWCNSEMCCFRIFMLIMTVNHEVV